jgi:hypothetical protein
MRGAGWRVGEEAARGKEKTMIGRKGTQKCAKMRRMKRRELAGDDGHQRAMPFKLLTECDYSR